MAPPHPPVDPPFVGRTRALETLRGLVARTTTGVGGAVRVCGEGGIGKTRLVAEALTGTDLPIARGAAEEAERGRPFAAPARALGLADLYRPTGAASAALAADAIWLAVDRVVEAAATRAGSGPSVLVLDDLQWADRGTWLAVAALARRAPAMGLLLVVIHRPLPARDPLPVPLDALGDLLELAPLDPAEALALARSVTGALDDVAAAQVGRAAGNAFFTIEVARWLRDRGALAGAEFVGAVEDSTLSPLLRTTVLGRVDDLGPDAVAVLRSVAVLGRTVTVSELARVTSRAPDLVAAAVEDAVAVGLLVDGPDGVAFRHDLVRSAVRGDIPASVIAAHDAMVLDATVVDPWAARHLAARAETGDEVAARVVLDAALAGGVAPETAAELLEEVLRLGPPPGVGRGRIACDLVTAVASAGDLRAASERGRALLAEAGSDDADGWASLRRVVARLEVGRGHVDDAVATLSALAGRTGAVGERARADLHLMEVMTLRRPAAVDDARVTRRETADPVVRCNAELTVAVHAMRAGRVDESVEAAGAAVAQCALEPGLTAELHPEIFLANALFYAERFAEASEALDHARRAAARVGVVWPVPHHLAHQAGAALRTGDLDGCRLAAREAVDWSLDTDQRIGATWPHVFTSVVAAHAGDGDEAHEALAFAEADLAAGRWQGTEAVPWAAALVAELAGDPAAAATRLAPVVELAAALGWNSRVPLLAPEAARMAWLAKDHDTVARMVAVSEAIAELTVMEVRAALLRCQGFAGGGPDDLVAAAGHYEEIGSTTQCATAWAEASLVAARSGDHDGALALLEQEALPRLEAIGAHGVVARTRAALPVRVERRIGRRRVRAVDGVASLTPAERRVVELVVTGATNAEIAAELVVSRRTVESHLSRIYRKLGVDSRVRLVASDPLTPA